MSDLLADVNAAIRDIPDFPEPGILFKDITPVLGDPTVCFSRRGELGRWAARWARCGLRWWGWSPEASSSVPRWSPQLARGLRTCAQAGASCPTRPSRRCPTIWSTGRLTLEIHQGRDQARASKRGDRGRPPRDRAARPWRATVDLVRKLGGEVIACMLHGGAQTSSTGRARIVGRARGEPRPLLTCLQGLGASRRRPEPASTCASASAASVSVVVA